MVRKLLKGDSLNLSQLADDSATLGLGLSWDDRQYSEVVRDLDMAAFLLGADGKIASENFLVYYNNLRSPDRAVVLMGDNRTGQEEGDDEVMYLHLNNISREVHSIILTASIYNTQNSILSFGEAPDLRLRLFNPADGEEYAGIELHEQNLWADALVLAAIVQEKGEWYLMVRNEGVSGGLPALADRFA